MIILMFFYSIYLAIKLIKFLYIAIIRFLNMFIYCNYLLYKAYNLFIRQQVCIKNLAMYILFFFINIGEDKIQRVKSFSALTVSKLSKEDIDNIILSILKPKN